MIDSTSSALILTINDSFLIVKVVNPFMTELFVNIKPSYRFYFSLMPTNVELIESPLKIYQNSKMIQFILRYNRI